MTRKSRFPLRSGWKRAQLAELERGSTVVQTACGPVEYVLSGEGPVVIAQHGTPGGYDQTQIFANDLISAGFSVLCWSRPGYLRTPIESGRSLEEQADLMAALLDTLNIDKAGIFGVSGGGPPTSRRHRTEWIRGQSGNSKGHLGCGSPQRVGSRCQYDSTRPNTALEERTMRARW